MHEEDRLSSTTTELHVPVMSADERHLLRLIDSIKHFFHQSEANKNLERSVSAHNLGRLLHDRVFIFEKEKEESNALPKRRPISAFAKVDWSEQIDCVMKSENGSNLDEERRRLRERELERLIIEENLQEKKRVEEKKKLKDLLDISKLIEGIEDPVEFMINNATNEQKNKVDSRIVREVDANHNVADTNEVNKDSSSDNVQSIVTSIESSGLKDHLSGSSFGLNAVADIDCIKGAQILFERVTLVRNRLLDLSKKLDEIQDRLQILIHRQQRYNDLNVENSLEEFGYRPVNLL